MLFFIDEFSFRLFGLIILMSSFGLNIIKKNLLFMSSGYGKGFFNLFTGMLLFINNDTGKTLTPNNIAGLAISVSGLIFICLSKFKDLSESDLDRHASHNRKEVYAAGMGVANKNQGLIKKAAYDNKDEIGKAAWNNRDMIGQAAYDNEYSNQGYKRNQNNQQNY
jgi:hypothetical protein